MGTSRSTGVIVLIALAAFLLPAVGAWALHCPDSSSRDAPQHLLSFGGPCLQQSVPAWSRTAAPVILPSQVPFTALHPAVSTAAWLPPASTAFRLTGPAARRGIALLLQSESFLL